MPKTKKQKPADFLAALKYTAQLESELETLREYSIGDLEQAAQESKALLDERDKRITELEAQLEESQQETRDAEANVVDPDEFSRCGDALQGALKDAREAAHRSRFPGPLKPSESELIATISEILSLLEIMQNIF